MGLTAVAVLACIMSFADELYEQEDYELATLEYSRILWEEGDTLNCPDAVLRLARCCHILGRYEQSLSFYTYLADRLPEGDFKAMAALGAGSVYADLGFFSRSREFYQIAAITAFDQDLAFKGELLGALTPLYRGEWTSSSIELSQVAQVRQGDQRLFAEELAEIADRGENLPRRSPLWCGIASAILPGSGQIICGHTTDGLIAFGMNAAIGTIFYLSLEEENTSTSILLGWLALSFYGGNIYGGSRAAEYYNIARRRELFEEVHDRLQSWAGE